MGAIELTNVPPIPKGFRIESTPATAPKIPAGFRIESTPKQGGDRGFTAFLNQGISSVLGAPDDIVNAGLDYAGLETGGDPFLGSKSIASGLRSLNVRTADIGAKPETLPEYIGRGAGAAAAAIPALLMSGRSLARAASPVARGVGATITRPFYETPVRALATEAFAGAGAGLGESVADTYAPDNKLAEMAGGLIGGVTAGLTPSLIASTRPVRWAGDKVAANIAPFTQAGGDAIAHGRFNELMRNPAEAAANLRAPTIAELSPAARTADPALMSLEQAVRRENRAVDIAMRDQERRAANQLTQAALDIAPNASPLDAREVLSSRARSIVSRLDDRANEAIRAAEARVNQLEPERRASESSVIVRDELNKAYADARAAEREIWQAVPDEIKVSTEQSKAAFSQLYKETPKALRDKISPKARQFLGRADGEAEEAADLAQMVFGGEAPIFPGATSGRFGAQETAKEMHGLYSALREEARIAASEKQLNRARIADRLAESVLSDLEKVDAVEGPLREALDFSRGLNQKFRQGTIGRILGRDRDGGQRVDPKMTLDVSVGVGGPSGAVSLAKLREATNLPLTAADDYMLSLFAKRAIRDGKISNASARTFINNNIDLLDAMPNVMQRIQSAIDAQSSAASSAASARGRSSGIAQGPAMTFSQARQGAEIDAILRSPDPARFARQAMMQAKDKGDGVRRAFIDNILDGARELGPSGEFVISGRDMVSRLNDPTYRAALSGVMKRDEISRLNQIANEFMRLEMMRSDPASAANLSRVGSVVDVKPSPVISTPIRVLAARWGAMLGEGTSGASLQTASMISKRAQDALVAMTNKKARDLIVKAINDRDAFELLMRPTQSLTRKQEIRLIETLTGTLGAETANQNGGE